MMRESLPWLCYMISSLLTGVRDSPAKFKEVSCHFVCSKRDTWKETSWGSMEDESSQCWESQKWRGHLIASRKWIWSLTMWTWKSTLSLRWDPRLPTDTLIATLWDMNQKIKLIRTRTPDSWELWDNKYVTLSC